MDFPIVHPHEVVLDEVFRIEQQLACHANEKSILVGIINQRLNLFSREVWVRESDSWRELCRLGFQFARVKHRFVSLLVVSEGKFLDRCLRDEDKMIVSPCFGLETAIARFTTEFWFRYQEICHDRNLLAFSERR